MLTIVLILLSAVALGIYDVCKKHAVHANAVMPVLFLGTLVGTLAVTAVLGMTGQITHTAVVPLRIWLLLLAKSGIVTASWICAYYGLRSLPISIAAPIRGSQPIWTVTGALLIFMERPNGLQWAGIGVTILGYYALSMIGRWEGICFTRHRGIGLILLATGLGAASGLYDKYLLQPMAISPATVQFWFQINLCLLIGAAWLIQRVAGLARTPFFWRWSIPAVGILLVISDILYFTALHQEGAMVSILSPIRRSNCVIAFLIGGALFKDQNRRAKAGALAMVVIGVILLCSA